MSIGLRTLVLNATYVPFSIIPKPHTIPAEDAISRVLNGTCHVVEEYDRKILTPNLDMNWPSVIARNEYVNVPEIVQLRKDNLYYRDHGICVYCEKPLSIRQVTYDHYIPRKDGGKRVWENIVSACAKCNQAKDDSSPYGEWEVNNKPYRPSYYQLLNNRKRFPLYVNDESWIKFFPEWEGEILLL